MKIQKFSCREFCRPQFFGGLVEVLVPSVKLKLQFWAMGVISGASQHLKAVPFVDEF